MNRICSLFWVSVSTLDDCTSILDAGAFHAASMADPSTSTDPAKITALRVWSRERQDTYASSCSFASKISSPCVFTVKELTLKSFISSYSKLWSLYMKWYISSKCLISQSAVDGMLSYKSIQRTNLESVRWLLSPKWLLTLQYTTQ